MASHPNWLLLLLVPAALILDIFLRKKKRRSSSSSSISSVVPERKYEVFLSFRGEDTRLGFLSHLCLALSQKKIDYFVDDQKLRQGDEISSALLAAIEQSDISLVIFSENYASSAWCLKELAHIMECKESHDQTVIPVFYKVDPSSVRHQSGSYQDAFHLHEKRFDRQSLQKWRDALKKAADLSGFHFINNKTEAEFVIEIVQRVQEKLNETGHFDDLKDFVGIQERIIHLEALLREKSEKVIMIGIWGTGGIGKTTTAEILFKRLSDEYEGRYFLRVRRGLQEHDMIKLKEELLFNLLGEHPDFVMLSGIPLGCERRLQRKKVLIVLDNINKSRELEILIEGCQWLGSDSRIIVTSRNKDAIQQCDPIYEVRQLSFEESLQLFTLKALPEVCLDKEQEWGKLLELVVEHAQGNPLAMKVLGCLFYGKTRRQWDIQLKNLDKIHDSEIQDVLQLSYDDLPDAEKDIFLSLACFFEHDSKERILSLLADGNDDDDNYIIVGLEVLKDRALITISEEGYVSMHDLIRKIGREIMRKKYPKNPGRRSHLWNTDDIYKVLRDNKGTEEIESVSLKMWKLKRHLHLRPEAFSQMDNLKLLRFETDKSRDHMVYVPEEFLIMSNKLRSLQWDCYPSKSIQLRSCVDNLVELSMRESRLQRLWDGSQEFPKLKIIDLSHSEELVEFPSLFNAPNLKEINLTFCHCLVELNLMGCDKLEDAGSGHMSSASIASEISEEHVYSGLRSLTKLSLEHCHNLTELKLGHLPSLEDLNISTTKVETLPTSIQYSSRLRRLHVGLCRKLRSLPELPPSIESLEAHYCSSLETPFSSLQYNLDDRTMSQSTLRRLRDIGMQKFSELKCLHLSCPVIKFLDLSIAPNIEEVWLIDCTSLVEVNLMGCDNLEDVGSGHISSASITSEISEEHVYSGLRSLKWLNLFACRSLTELKWGHLPSLEKLTVEDCGRLQSLQELPLSIEEFSASDCPSLEILSPSLQYYNLVKLTMQHKNLGRFFWDGVQEFPYLMSIDLSYSEEVTEFLDLLNAPYLRDVNLSGTNVETLPTIIKRSSRLWSLHVEHCRRLRSLQELPSSIVKLRASDCPSLKTVQFNSLPPSPRPFDKFCYEFKDCLELDEQAIEAIVKHWQLGVATAGEVSTLIYTGSKVPECLGDYRTTQDSVLVKSQLALLSKLKGLIFYFVLLPQDQKREFLREINVRISRNVPKLWSTQCEVYLGHDKWDHVDMLYIPISSSHEVWEWEEIFESRDSTNDQFVKVWLEIYRKPTPPECIDTIKEWGVCPVYN